MFTTLIVQPIFNLLTLIYAIIPGHNFGLAIILFTIAIRLLMWPLVKKQLHQTKVMRKLQPELKKIKKAAKGDRRKESMMQMELYRERGINPFASLGPLLLQLPIFIGLYSGLQRVVRNPQEIIDFSYPFIQDLNWMQQLATNIHQFDETLFGVIDLTRAALGNGGIYWPAMLIVVASVVVQYYQAKQLMPQDKEARSLRQILREAGEGRQADQSEVNAAVGRSTKFLLPALVFFFTVSIASALSLYWLVSGVVAYIQQAIVLNKDDEEMDEIANESAKKLTHKDTKNIPEAEIVEKPKKKTNTNKAKRANKRKKRRK
jgi:YidC/Oxa1 family membrane protein insertase